jgi:hypothetical protein
MDYYEELGVHRVAEVEDIRRAWRNLARLLHPDQQQEEGLRLLAEKQMKRLNEICAVLTDPVERLRYDRSLLGAPPPRPRAGLHPRWMLAAVLAAFAVGAAALYPRRAAPRAVWREPAGATVAAALVTPTPARRHAARHDGPVPLRRQQEPPPVEALSAPVDPPPEIAATGADLPPRADLLPAAVAQSPREPAPNIAGAWFYAPLKSVPASAVLYPPEFIEVFITEAEGTIYGRYRARYKVGDRPISGDVQFSFEGRRQDGRIVLAWTGSQGACGKVRLELLADDTLQLDWQATELGDSIGLASGAAILTRRRGL